MALHTSRTTRIDVVYQLFLEVGETPEWRIFHCHSNLIIYQLCKGKLNDLVR